MTYGMVAVPVELVLGVSAEKDMFAVIPHMLVGMDVGVVNPLMAKPVTCAFREKSPPKRIIVARSLLKLKFFMYVDLQDIDEIGGSRLLHSLKL